MPFPNRLTGAQEKTSADHRDHNGHHICSSDHNLLPVQCMSGQIPKTLFILLMFVLFNSWPICSSASNHSDDPNGHFPNRVFKKSDSIVGNDKSRQTRASSASLTSLNQLRMLEEKAVPKNVTAQIGLPVYLHCIVEPVGDKMVSWIRLRDFHLLTVGPLTYISDDRFVVRHGTLQSNDWALQIKHVVPTDEGLYECQINSDPPRSQYYYLHVVVPVAEMIGQTDMFVRTGNTINLTCVISRSPEPPAFVFWYHNERMINYDYNPTGRGEITVQKDLSKSDAVISRLVIRSAKLQDSGNYTCSASNAEPTSLYVHVLQGEKRLSSRIQNDEASIEHNSGHSGGTAGNTALSSCFRSANIVFALIVFALKMRFNDILSVGT